MQPINSWLRLAFAIVATHILVCAQTASAVSATGGYVTNIGVYAYHVFTNNGPFTVTSGGNVEVLVVGGGGAGGFNGGGGGGAGGLIYSNGFSVIASNYSVMVGLGGGVAPYNASWTTSNGLNSAFGPLTAVGGGGGTSRDWGPQGALGGSGGGGAGAAGSPRHLAGSGTAGQGNSGGAGTAPDLGGNAAGGGGGGAGAAGGAASSLSAGSGGVGLQYTNFAVVGGSPAGWFAGGGAGGKTAGGSNAFGGTNGGGGNFGVAGVAKTGGGGGAGAGGGSGIVIVRYHAIDPVILNLAVTDVAYNSVTLNAFLTSTGASPTTVSVYWGPADQSTNAALWATNAFVGTYLSSGPVSLAIADLAPTSRYYYAFFASNAATSAWAQPSGVFQTVGPVMAGNGSATAVTASGATLGASLDGDEGVLRIYWGLADGGTNPGAWQNTNDFGEVLMGSYSASVSVLASAPYYYRAYATNVLSEDWADATAQFSTPAPAVSLSIANATCSETNGVRPLIVATLGAASASNVTVNFAFAGTAGKDADYTSSVDSVTIPALSLSNSIALGALDDALPEADESAIVRIASLVNATNGAKTNVTAILQSDDPQITNGGGANPIGQGTATLNGNLTLGKAATVRVFWGDTDGGTIPTSWAATNRVGTSAINEGAFSTNVTGLLASKFYYYRCYATNASMLGEAWAASTATFTSGVTLVSINDATVTEGDGGEVSATFTVVLATLSVTNVSVNFATADGTATAGVNYTATNGVVTIPAGQAEAQFTVKVLGNTVFDNPDKFFVVNLTSPVACTIADGQGVGTIRDEDAAGHLASWKNWMPITFSGYGGTTTLTNWPALVRFAEGTPVGFAYHSFASGTGGDLRFASSNLTRLLDFEIEKWNSGGESLIWVRVPELPPGGTTIWAYWNDPGETTLPASATNGATWDSGYRGVWHLGEALTAGTSGGRNYDATVNHYDGTQSNNGATNAMIGRGQYFNGNAKVTIGAAFTTNAYTKETWVRLTTNGNIMSGTNSHVFWVTGGNLKAGHNGTWTYVADPAGFPTGSWQHVAVTYASGAMALYRNGVQVNSASGVPAPNADPTLYLAAYVGANYMTGSLDEGRLSGVVRSADWIKASYSNQVQGSTFSTIGAVLGLPVIGEADGATNITLNSAFATARLVSTGGASTVTGLYWGETDGGQVPGNWGHTQDLGTVASVPANYSVLLSPLTDSTRYFYAYAATNLYGSDWASASFYTAGRPSVSNGGGATPNTGFATLNGNLLSTGESLTTVYTYWGDIDGGTNPLAWRAVITNTVSGVGPFSAVASNLFYGVQYFYRTYASNAYGDAWAPGTSGFLTLKPIAAGGTLGSSSTILLANVPEAANYDLIYEFPIPVSSPGWNTAGNNPYSINNATNFTKPFTRIAYYLQLAGASPTQWVYVSMDRFTTNVTKIGLPTTLSGEFFHYGTGGNGGGPISNAAIRSNVGTVTTGDGINTINLEFWPSNYTQSNDYGVPGANGSVFDFGDGGAGTSSGYGCMQVHNYAAGQTLFAYNAWGAARTSELGIGNQVGGSGNPDGTFNTTNGGGFTNRMLQILVGPYVGTALGITNRSATGITNTSATLNATLLCSGAVYDVTAFWGTTSGGTNAALWTNSVPVGSWTNVASTNISCGVAGLIPSTDYFFAFRATNAADVLWASNVLAFTTPGPLAARFSALPTTCNPSMTVQFSDNSLPGPTGTITNRYWDFGDGTTLNTTATNLFHLYTQLGAKTVQLIVSDDVGGTSTNIKVAYINVQETPSSLTWTPTAAGTYNWNNAGPQDNWATSPGGTFPNATDDTANLNIDIAGNQIINLNQAVTIGALNLGDTGLSSFTHLVQSGAGGSLIFDVASGYAQINKASAANSATDTVSATVTLNDPLLINNQAAGAVQITGAILGGGLTKIGGGTLILGSASNTFTSAAVSGGTLQGDSRSLVSDVLLSNAANVTLNQATLGTFGRVISGVGTLTKTGGGTLSLTAAQTYGGATFIRGGAVQLGASGGVNGVRIMPVGDSITFGSGGSNAGYRGPLYSLLTAEGLQFQFVGASSGNPGTLPSTPVNQQYHNGYSGWSVGQILSYIALWLGVNPDIITLMIGTNNTGNDLPTVMGQLAQIIETVHINKPNTLLMVAQIIPKTGQAAWISQYNASIATLVNGKIAAGYNLVLVDLNTGYPPNALPDDVHPNDTGYNWMAQQWHDVIVANTSGGSNLLPVTTALTIASNATLNLNGGSQQIASLSDDSGRGGCITNSSSTAASTLILNTGFGSTTFSGSIRDAGGQCAISLVKSGSGTQVLSGDNTYSGGTTISNGTLAVIVGGSCANSAVTVTQPAAGSAALAVSITNNTMKWTCASLTTAGSGPPQMTFDYGDSVTPGTTVAPLDVTGAATFALTPTVIVVVKAGGLVVGESYPLMTWGSTFGTASTSATLAGGMSGTADLTVIGSTLYLSLSAPPPVFSGNVITVSGGASTLYFDTVAGFRYGMDYRNTLMTGSWQAVINPPDFPPPDGWSAISTGVPMTLTDTNAVDQPQRFYRLKAAPP